MSLVLTDWLSRHADTLGLAALAAVALVVLRSIFKSLAAPAAGGAAPATNAVASPATLATEQVRSRQPPRRPAIGFAAPPATVLRDELAEVVRDDPRAAVSILRNWIGNAG